MNIAARWKRSLRAIVVMEKSHPMSMRLRMPRRVLTALAMAAVGLPAIIYGGVFYFLLMTIFLAGSAWEFVRLYRAVQVEPHEIVTIGGVLVIATARFFFSESTVFLLALSILLAMTAHVVAYERGRDKAG